MFKGEGLFHESYLGDGAYVGVLSRYAIGHEVVLYTTDGLTQTNRIVLEPGVLHSFEEWLARVRAEDQGDAEDPV